LGEVNNAQGFVTVKDTDIGNISTVWNNNSRPKSAISVIADSVLNNLSAYVAGPFVDNP